MDKKTNLDDYLADLGISEAEDEAPPRRGAEAAAPSPAALESPAAVVERFLLGLLSRLDDSLSLTVRETEDGGVMAEIGGERATRLTGHDGQLLHAIELLAHTALARHVGRDAARVRLDAGGFRRRHDDNLTRLAERLAVQVAKSGEAHALQPMPPADRRVMHIALKEHPDVITESAGEGPGRHLVVKPRPM